MRYLILCALLSVGCASAPRSTMQDFKAMYLDTCAEGHIPEDSGEAFESGYDCALELLHVQGVLK